MAKGREVHVPLWFDLDTTIDVKHEIRRATIGPDGEVYVLAPARPPLSRMQIIRIVDGVLTRWVVRDSLLMKWMSFHIVQPSHWDNLLLAVARSPTGNEIDGYSNAWLVDDAGSVVQSQLVGRRVIADVQVTRDRATWVAFEQPEEGTSPLASLDHTDDGPPLQTPTIQRVSALAALSSEQAWVVGSSADRVPRLAHVRGRKIVDERPAPLADPLALAATDEHVLVVGNERTPEDYDTRRVLRKGRGVLVTPATSALQPVTFRVDPPGDLRNCELACNGRWLLLRDGLRLYRVDVSTLA